MSSQMEMNQEKEISEFLAGNKGQEFLQRQMPAPDVQKLYMGKLQEHVLEGGYEKAIQTLSSGGEFKGPLSKEENIKSIVALLPPEVKERLHEEIQRYQEIQSITYLTFDVEVHGLLMENGIDFGEGPISVRSMKDFGIGKYDSDSKTFELTYEEKEIFVELNKKYREQNLNAIDSFDYYEDTLHATAGVMKIMEEGKSKKEAMQIVDDLRKAFGIKKFGRYDAATLIEQHNNTEIDSEKGTYELKIDNKKEQTIFISGHYEYNGAAYKIEGEETTSSITRKINGLKKEGQAQVWIYEKSHGDEIITTLQNFDYEMESKKYNIVISAHGNSQEILLGGERKKDPKERQREDYYLSMENMKKNSEFFESLNGRVDNIVIMACSNRTDGDINFLAKEFHEKTNATVISAGEPVYGVIFRKEEPKIMFKYENRIDGSYYGTQIYTNGQRLGYLKSQKSYNERKLEADYVNNL
jgi:hypothetical protein